MAIAAPSPVEIAVIVLVTIGLIIVGSVRRTKPRLSAILLASGGLAIALLILLLILLNLRITSSFPEKNFASSATSSEPKRLGGSTESPNDLPEGLADREPASDSVPAVPAERRVEIPPGRPHWVEHEPIWVEEHQSDHWIEFGDAHPNELPAIDDLDDRQQRRAARRRQNLPIEERGTQFVYVTSGQWDTDSNCQDVLDIEIQARLEETISSLIFGEPGGRRHRDTQAANLIEQMVLSSLEDCVAARYTETLQVTLGPLDQVEQRQHHALLEFDSDFRETIREQWRHHVVHGRLMLLAWSVGIAIALLALFWGNLKFGPWRREE